MKHTTNILLVLLMLPALAFAQKKKPNILVIWGDDIGWSNVSYMNNGLMGYKTPNIDRIANEGAKFTDWYGQQSCTAGRAAFILGQHPFRTGLLTIGMPGSKQGIQDNQATIAEVLKPQGYVSGQFGKNHLGDQDQHLPTAHGFDEFFGNLYHLNAEEEPEGYYYPKDPDFRKKYGPRGVLKSSADGKVQDTGPLTKKRMETVDEEFEAAAVAFIKKAHAEGKPFFCWFNSTRVHVWTHLKPESEGATGIGLYPDAMAEHDLSVGRLLDLLDELGIADNTIVMYSTDNGAEKFTWPDGGTTPFAGEKGTTWEGGFRVPTAIRWPGVIKPGTVYNDIFSHEDMMPTLAAAAGEPNLKEKMLKGYKANNKTFKSHLDGYNLMPYFQGKEKEGPRKEIFYFDAGGNMNAIRYNNWKLHFTIMEGSINEAYRKAPSWPIVINLRADPYEVSWKAALYTKWYGDNMWLFVPAQAYAGQFLSTFKEYPPVMGSSLSIDKVVQSMTAPPKN
ncbi:arylsulfatase [Reichenbachiella agarivorans]|uniref:Arylsulfatase n=1 Tax=Reichenbachiella agarivorans TaxID=2979464 RepID=A0ABY6CN29_9BACT|nr:arylsulfatase [Reichenbachiella agarivorans]UXP31925.1 arylsulfatase [Reichenbachiella agarivorans]